MLVRSEIPEKVHLEYANDWYNVYRANTPVILLPETTEHVSEILKYCNQESIAVVPQSGNTGASGGKHSWHLVSHEKEALVLLLHRQRPRL